MSVRSAARGRAVASRVTVMLPAAGAYRGRVHRSQSFVDCSWRCPAWRLSTKRNAPTEARALAVGADQAASHGGMICQCISTFRDIARHLRGFLRAFVFEDRGQPARTLHQPLGFAGNIDRLQLHKPGNMRRREPAHGFQNRCLRNVLEFALVLHNARRSSEVISLSWMFSKAGKISRSTMLLRIALVLPAIQAPASDFSVTSPNVLTAVRRHFSRCGR